MTRAFVFPGQGSQSVGMGRDLAQASPAARETFEEVDDALGQNLTRLMFDGPAEDLTLTENAQPALMAVSLAILRVLEREAGFSLADKIALVAGHSLGEYAALAAARAFDLADAARLLKARGRAMQQAVAVGEGAMAAILGLGLDDVLAAAAEAAADGEVCAVANDNAPGQVVVSGQAAAVQRAVELAKALGAKRAMVLNVSAPFHCALMQPAADEMAARLAEVPPRRPVVPLVANVSARPSRDPELIARQLVAQVTAMVRWRECVLAIRDAGHHELIEVGAGKVLTGLARRIDRDLDASALNGPDDIEAFLGRV